MITINELRRAERGIKCNMCHGDILVKELNFRADGAPGGTSIFLCEQCRAELAYKLGITRICEEGNQNDK